MKKIELLVELLNKAWELIPEKPTYGEFNKIFPVLNNKNKLRKLEKENPILGLAKFNTEQEGLSTISILSTITDFYEPGMRLAANVDISNNDTDNYQEKLNDAKILGFHFIDCSEKTNNESK